MKFKFLNKLKTYQKIFLFAILINIAIAVLDILSMQSGIFGSTDNYIIGNFGVAWFPLFFKFNLIAISLISISYFFFYRHDFSETISLSLGSVLIWFSGLPDILFFWFRGVKLPITMNWLNNGIIIGNVSKILGYADVTNLSIKISAILGLIATYFGIKFLVKRL